MPLVLIETTLDWSLSVYSLTLHGAGGLFFLILGLGLAYGNSLILWHLSIAVSSLCVIAGLASTIIGTLRTRSATVGQLKGLFVMSSFLLLVSIATTLFSGIFSGEISEDCSSPLPGSSRLASCDFGFGASVLPLLFAVSLLSSATILTNSVRALRKTQPT